MTAYTFGLKRTECEAATHEADDLHAAIKSALDAHSKDGFLVNSVEWDGGEAELHGRCEVCPTECVTVFDCAGISENYHTDGDGIRLCKPCWQAHLDDIQESGETS